ncbi:hypothetical protein P5673_007715 [Acropora cervicornis]|uniref:Uncharacterized protein n=1 Tax=Acropora cervicornis TaxID=6130 RepID=A0AAD9QUV7_ACRCE|nr:hypothetical protein P5673_007715 [Acropora cervicornis]
MFPDVVLTMLPFEFTRDFRALMIFCFAFLVVSVSGASLCKCGPEDNKAAVPEFTVKVRSGEKEIDEKVTVNTEEETETFHITNDSDSGDVDIIYDFKREAQQGPMQVKDQRTTNYMLGSSVHDRSLLSDEMAAMCDKYPINSIEPEEEIVSVGAHEQANAKRRRKRHTYVIIRTIYCIHIFVMMY